MVSSANTARQRRKRIGISQPLLAKLVGVSLPSVYLWEKEITRPNPVNEAALEEVLSTLERGAGVCPFGYALGDEFGKHGECLPCPHRWDCSRYRAFKQTLTARVTRQQSTGQI